MADLIAVLAPAIRAAVANAISDPGVPVESPAPVTAAIAVTEDVLDRVAAEPTVQHATNTEPWFQSRVTLGALVAGVAPLAGLVVGRDVTAADQAQIVQVLAALGTLAGVALTLYGRWRARKPLGA